MGLVRGDAEEDEEQRTAVPVVSIAKEKILEVVREKEKGEKPVLSLVVVGTSPEDCGSSEGLMGRVGQGMWMRGSRR